MSDFSGSLGQSVRMAGNMYGCCRFLLFLLGIVDVQMCFEVLNIFQKTVDDLRWNVS